MRWLLALIVLALALPAEAQTYPQRPVRLVLGFGPGGVADIVARTVAPKLGDALGQQVVVDNRPSAGGIVAAEAVAKAEPDGHTLLLISGGNAVSSSLYKSLSYDPINDFAMVSSLGFFDLAIVVDPASPVVSLKELIQSAKDKPGTINVGTIGIGSTQHLSAELFRSLAGINVVIVNYRATPAVMLALKGGEVQVAVEFLAPLAGQIKSGAVRALGATNTKRSPMLPDVPTVSESGLAGYEATSWNGVAAPARTPATVIQRLNQELVKIVDMPDVKARLLELGVEARGSTPEWLRGYFRSESEKWGQVIARAGIEKQ
ncbi:MAG: tripartite tricarboxylate transporter substrate binding protein [Alphaproteobacteria bacterium]|nr:tripartite tricarboxylate transporter substrate binding protein [Alphaproteobacteria bacterium]